VASHCYLLLWYSLAWQVLQIHPSHVLAMAAVVE
jgi:hypothetical protein